MRRKDREKDSAFAYALFKDCEYATLATMNEDFTPYCIPVSPVVIDGSIFFHCAKEGQKLDNIRRNSDVCISCVSSVKPVPEKFTTEYCSAVAFGKCEEINDRDEKIDVLKVICEKYAYSNMGGFEKEIAESLGKTCVCKIKITSITGKENR